MFRFLSQLSIGPGLLLFVVVPALLSAYFAVFVRRWKPISMLSQNNEFAAIMYPVIGLFYGVFLAFAIVIVWQRFTDAQESTYKEVAALSQLWRDAQVFPPGVRVAMQNRMKEYAAAVSDEEWPQMASIRAELVQDKHFDNLWSAFYAYEPRTELEKVFYDKSLDQLNLVGTSRRQRLMFSVSEMPWLLWAFLLFGGLVTVLFSYFLGTKHLLMHSLTCAALTALVGFSLFLIMSLQYPFAGSVHVQDTPYRDLLQVLDARSR